MGGWGTAWELSTPLHTSSALFPCAVGMDAIITWAGTAAPQMQDVEILGAQLWRSPDAMRGATILSRVCGGGGAGARLHDAWLCCCLQLAASIGLSPLTIALPLKRFPPQVAVPIGLSPPCALPLPAWPFLTSLLTLPFPW